MRDLILYFAFAGLPIVSFWLQQEAYPETPFYASMLVVFLIILVWMKSYYKDESHARLVDFDENMQASSFLWITGGIVACYIVASMIIRTFAASALFVPRHMAEMSYFGLQLSPLWNDILFQMTLVATAEELSKLVVMLAIYMRLKSAKFGDGMCRLVAIVVPIFFWSMMHIYRNPAYQGSNMAIMVAAAFVAGLVIYGVMYKSKNLLGAILTHAGYNILVILLTSAA
jgi:membrane protease YdiL (CAAX protease family)